ncbi:MAG: acyltransferase 3 [Flavisolibacter sp.]|nr:acyltransferase 3 [Flavisolibacter sp.]
MNGGRAHYPGLDALRGIAIILVVLYHYFPFFRIGWIGVDLFFVLSGFLITGILLRTREEKNYFRNFFLRRAFRIFPLYFLVLIVFYICSPLLFTQKQVGSAYFYYTNNQVWFWTFTENWLLIRQGPPPEPYLQHFWSLAIEEQFYLVWPFLLYGVRSLVILKYFLVALFFMAISLRVILWIYFIGHEAFYYNTFARVDGFAAGAFLSILVFQKERISKTLMLIAFFGLAAVFFCAILVSKNLDHNSAPFATVGYSVAALFFMCICFKLINSNSIIARSGFLKQIGRISYGIYVYHIPVFLIGSYVLHKIDLLNDSGSNVYVIPFICIGATFLISSLSYKLIELPCLRFRNKLL